MWISLMRSASSTAEGAPADTTDRNDADTEKRALAWEGEDGVVRYERYLNGMDERTLHLSQSVAKSVTGAVAGILIDRGLLDPGMGTGNFFQPREALDVALDRLFPGPVAVRDDPELVVVLDRTPVREELVLEPAEDRIPRLDRGRPPPGVGEAPSEPVTAQVA